MTYEEFIKKWVGKSLYEDNRVHTLAGRITRFQNDKMTVPILGEIVVDTFWLPKWSGWKDDAQRREFYRDAKKVGLRRKPHQVCEWYKLMDIVN